MASRDGDSDIGDRKGKKREKKRENEKREKRERREREHANLQHRKKLVQELLESERAHVAALNTVVTQYLQPLEQCNPPVLPTSMINEIFSNLVLVRNWHQAFYAALETHLQLGDQFGEVFVDMIPLMRQLYTQFHENFDHGMDTYKEAKGNKAFAQFLERKQKEIGENKDLLTYLYLPVQRMIAYDSLLKDILNLLPEDDEDYPLLSKSLQALRQIQLNATQRAKQRKNIDKVIEIQNRLSDSTQLALPHRRYVFEGEVLLVQPDGQTFKDRLCFLFNDLFVCCKRKGKKGQLEVEFKEPLETLHVEDLIDTQHFRYLFKLTSSANEYLLSSEEKDNWVHLIMLCKKEWTQLRNEAKSTDDILHNETEGSSREGLMMRIIAWSKMKDAEEVHKQIKALATQLEHSTALQGTRPAGVS